MRGVPLSLSQAAPSRRPQKKSRPWTLISKLPRRNPTVARPEVPRSGRDRKMEKHGNTAPFDGIVCSELGRFTSSSWSKSCGFWTTIVFHNWLSFHGSPVMNRIDFHKNWCSFRQRHPVRTSVLTPVRESVRPRISIRGLGHT